MSIKRTGNRDERTTYRDKRTSNLDKRTNNGTAAHTGFALDAGLAVRRVCHGENARRVGGMQEDLDHVALLHRVVSWCLVLHRVVSWCLVLHRVGVCCIMWACVASSGLVLQ